MPWKIFQRLCSSNCDESTRDDRGVRLPFRQKLFYGVGHVFNDLCANCWFSYLLLYMTKVISLSNANAGLVLLIGQVANAISTAFIGYGCDKTNVKCYGRRKLWHLIGTFCVLLSLPFIFNQCINCENASTTILLVYYSGFAIVFQFGWASVQISHLSLIPEIARKTSEKVELNAIRSGLRSVCGIYVFVVAWLLLGSNPEESVNRSLAPQFMQLSIIVIGTGFAFSLVFHFGTKEPRNYGKVKKITEDSTSIENSLKETVVNHNALEEDMVELESNNESINHKSVNRESISNESVNHKSANHESVNHKSANHKSVNHESISDESVNHKSANHEPTIHEPINHNSVNHKSVNHESISDELILNARSGDSEAGNNSAAVVRADEVNGDVFTNDIDLIQPSNCNKEEKCKNWKEWFKSSLFYRMAVVHMCTQLTLNVSQAYFVLYLTETMHFEKEAIAYFPLLLLVCGALASILVKPLTKRIGFKFTFIIGCLCALVSFFWLFFVNKDARKSVYVAAMLMGSGCSIMLITSLAMTADLIGSHRGSGAFVYSAMVFTDKLSSGIVIYVIQQLKPSEESGTFTRYVQSIVTGVSCILALACVAIFFPSDYSKKPKNCPANGGGKTLVNEANHNKALEI
eukprot:gene140-752_t